MRRLALVPLIALLLAAGTGPKIRTSHVGARAIAGGVRWNWTLTANGAVDSIVVTATPQGRTGVKRVYTATSVKDSLDVTTPVLSGDSTSLLLAFRAYGSGGSSPADAITNWFRPAPSITATLKAKAISLTVPLGGSTVICVYDDSAGVVRPWAVTAAQAACPARL